ncbi:hypothetical protein ONZ45_g15034 [Pleurotus djamor]|nr:hypothetical protein ONZ45_g15034 [Pleurotus djamor]
MPVKHLHLFQFALLLGHAYPDSVSQLVVIFKRSRNEITGFTTYVSRETMLMVIFRGAVYPRLALDFHTNKRIIGEVAVVPSKRLRNKIAGFTTHLMKRIQKGPVRGISFKLQEEERERKDDYVPEVSALDVSATVGGLEVDSDTKDLLVALNFADIPITIVNPVLASQDRPRRERRNVPGAAPRT